MTMSHIRRIAAAVLMTLVLAAPAVVSAADVIQQQAFHDALGAALNASRLFEDAKYSSGRTEVHGTASEMLPDSGPWGAWRLIPRGNWDVEGYGMKTVFSASGVAVVTNRGIGYDFAMLTQPIPAIVFDRVVEKLEDRLDDFQDRPAPATVEWGVQDGCILIAASHDWNGNANTVVLKDQLHSLILRSKGLIGDIIMHSIRERDELRDDYKDRRYTTVTREEFELLVDRDDWSPWFKGTDTAAGGTWSFVVEDEPYIIHNHGDRIEFVHQNPVPAGLGEQGRTALLEQLTAIAHKADAEDDPTVSVAWSGSELHVSLVYDLTDGVKGDRFEKWYKKLWEDYGTDVGKKFRKVLEQIEKDRRDAKPTSLDMGAFLALIDDGLEDISLADGSGPGGSWSFIMADDYDVEVHNRGDSMELWLNLQVPDGADPEATLASAVKAVGDRRPKQADSVTVDWYPGAEGNWIAVTATCRFDGNRKGKQIRECYEHFTRDWCREMQSRILKAFSG